MIDRKDRAYVMICMPVDADAACAGALLSDRGYPVRRCADADEAAALLGDDTGAILVTEEALRGETALPGALRAQAPWSDIQVICLAGQRGATAEADPPWRLPADAVLNLVILDRPCGADALASAVASAVRARARQLEARDRLADLAEERLRLDTLMQGLPLGINILDANGRSLRANAIFRKFRPDGVVPSLTRNEDSHWVGFDTDNQVLGPDRFPVARARRGERVDGVEFLHKPIGAPALWTRVGAYPMRGPGGEIAGIISIIADIDREKRAIEDLGQLKEMLEAEAVFQADDPQHAATLTADGIASNWAEAVLHCRRGETGRPGHGETVLVVERDASVRHLACEVLKDLGYATIEASTAADALPVIGGDQPVHLMIADVALPDIPGRQLAELSHQLRPKLPILLMSDYAENAALRSAYLGEDTEMICKPFARDALARKIGAMMAPPPSRMVGL